MGLVINNNVASLTAQHNLSRTSNALSKSLERLSSGLKINRGADGPAALVISEQQRAQIAGLQTAIDTLTFLQATDQAAAGTYAGNIATAAQRAVVKVNAIQSKALAKDETLTLNGVSIGLTAGSTAAQVQGRINEFTAQTGVVAEN